MGYHVRNIEKGVCGELSKVNEEVQEAIDADAQNNPVMVLVELSDIIGAIECYLEANYKETITLDDLIVMSKATRRAFQTGARTCKNLANTPATHH
jgi:DNA polymerase II large subunit